MQVNGEEQLPTFLLNRGFKINILSVKCEQAVAEKMIQISLMIRVGNNQGYQTPTPDHEPALDPPGTPSILLTSRSARHGKN